MRPLTEISRVETIGLCRPGLKILSESHMEPSLQTALRLRVTVCLSGMAACMLGGQGVLGADAIAPDPQMERLMSLKLEDILNTEITSASKRPEKWFDSAAAVQVITAEDIRRSGARSLPDLLRMSPGLSVGQINSHQWAVGSRGMTERYTSTLLAMIDGRANYTPITSGVVWHFQDYPLEDIERIEVIRGPGGTLWGANAVNGVINIITKSSRDTLGGSWTSGAGSEQRGFTSFRYGGRVNEDTTLRGYFQYKNHDNFEPRQDSWDFFQTGMRSDWEKNDNKLTFSSDYFQGRFDNQVALPNLVPPYFSYKGPEIAAPLMGMTVNSIGANGLMRFTRDIAPDSDLQLQVYLDHWEQRDVYEHSQQTLDLDFQHRIPLPLRQSLIYGLGYRYFPNYTQWAYPEWYTYDPQRIDWQTFSAFVQDDISLVEDRLRLTLGTKVEHHDPTGWEVQPNARLLWTPHNRHTVWAAVSRAVQVPGRAVNDIRIPYFPSEPQGVVAGLPVFVGVLGNRSVESQEMLGYELGYRFIASETLSFDLATYYNRYDNLFSIDPGANSIRTVPVPHIYTPLMVGNRGAADTYGAELSAEWRVTEIWKLSGAYTHLQMELNPAADGFSPGDDPKHQASLRSSLDLPADLELDLWGRYVHDLKRLGFGPDFQTFPAYFDLDVRLGWKPRKNLEFSVVGQNLISPRRYEFSHDTRVSIAGSAVQRGFYLQATLKF